MSNPETILSTLVSFRDFFLTDFSKSIEAYASEQEQRYIELVNLLANIEQLLEIYLEQQELKKDRRKRNFKGLVSLPPSEPLPESDGDITPNKNTKASEVLSFINNLEKITLVSIDNNIKQLDQNSRTIYQDLKKYLDRISKLLTKIENGT